jgi:predicted nucleic acid-binding protein
MRVFLDANVLFSAAYMDAGSPRALFDVARAGAGDLVSSAYAIEEARRNLLMKRAAKASDLEALVKGVVVVPEPSAPLVDWATTLGLPDKDAPILAAAVEAHCQLLVTGDLTHFGHLFGKRHRGVVVLRPVEAIEILI